MDEKRYRQLLRLAGLTVSVAMLFVSANFSVAGFNFNAPGFEWLGWTMALFIVVIELIFDEHDARQSLTIFVIGALAYGYGIVTNIYGIWVAQGQPDYAQQPWAIAFPAILGVLLEVAPEPLMLWSLGISASGARDIIAHILGQTSPVKPEPAYHNDRPNADGRRADQFPRQGQPSNNNGGGQTNRAKQAQNRFRELVQGANHETKQRR